MERHGHLSLSDKTRADLLELSAATADRIFRQFRFDHRPHGKTPTKSRTVTQTPRSDSHIRRLGGHAAGIHGSGLGCTLRRELGRPFPPHPGIDRRGDRLDRMSGVATAYGGGHSAGAHDGTADPSVSACRPGHG